MRISDLVFGCGPIGSYAADGDPDGGREALAAALAGGVRRFDAAPSYGDGWAEELLGAAVEGRDDVVISTKVGRRAMGNSNPYARPGNPSGPRGGGDFDFTPDGVRSDLAASLRRLRRESVDTVFVHDPECALDLVSSSALPTLRQLRDEGVVGSVGVASTRADVALDLVRGGAVQIVMIAAAWTLTRRNALPLLDECLVRGVPVLAAAPFDSGLLATDRPDPSAPWAYRRAPAEMVELADRLAEICARHGTRLPQAALQFPLRHPAVTGVVVGARTAHEIITDLALTAPVPAALWPELDAARD